MIVGKELLQKTELLRKVKRLSRGNKQQVKNGLKREMRLPAEFRTVRLCILFLSLNLHGGKVFLL